jgi:hypothetical protein
LLLLNRLPFLVISLGGWRRLRRLATVFLQQFLSGVVFSGDLELLDGFLSLFVEVVKASLVAADLVIKELGADLADPVDTGKMS